ncbi:MAG: zinc metalloprotease [Ferruginibacter sp.]
MKKILTAWAGCVILVFGCTKSSVTEEEIIDPETTSGISAHKCASQEVLEQQLKEDPALAERMRKIESVIDYYESNPTAGRLINGYVEIPVVVNVLYKTAAENISATQIQTQIDVLNQDFAATNSDYNNTPATFQSVRAGDTKIKFVLSSTVRKSTNKKSWGTNDAMKKSSTGGIDPTNPTTSLNIWSCNMGGGILGYAQFPGGSAATDGVVIDNNAFGNTGTAAAPYGKGRTATHEVGHWLNLRHIWGDATCGNDLVNDTPVAQSSNGGCPAFPSYGSCSSTVPMMTMNYMDYTYDACMYMFTSGQNTRMQATFAVGGGRYSFAQP